MYTALLFAFFVTPFLARRPFEGTVTVETLVFAAFLATLVLRPRLLDFMQIYRRSVTKSLVWSPVLLLATFLFSSMVTSGQPYEHVPYFAGYALIFLVSVRAGWNLKKTNGWLKYLPFLIAVPAYFILGTVNQDDGMRWTEFSLLIGFGGLVAATSCNLRSLSGWLHGGLLMAASVLTIVSLSVGGILAFGLLAAVIGLKRLNRTRLSHGMRLLLASIFLITLLGAVALSTDREGVTIAERVQQKFEHHFVSNVDDEETDVRVKIYAYQLDLFKEHWQFGIGLDQFKNMNTAGHGGVPIVNHNNLLKCLSEGGILVGLAYLIFLYCFMHVVIRVLMPSRKNRPEFSLELVVLACGIAFLIVRGFAMDTLFLRQFFVLSGLFAGRYSAELKGAISAREEIKIIHLALDHQ